MNALAQVLGGSSLVAAGQIGDQVSVTTGVEITSEAIDGPQLLVGQLVFVGGEPDRQANPLGDGPGQVAFGVRDETVDPGLPEVGLVIIVDQAADHIED